MSTNYILDEFTSHVFVNRPCERLDSIRSYVTDKHGNCWRWNCGWRIVGRDMPALTHAQFNRNIQRAERLDYKNGLNVKRPDGMWRRVLDTPYELVHTGEMGRVVMTDGVHAVFKCRHRHTGEWIRKEVMFNNLNECKPDQRVAFERSEKKDGKEIVKKERKKKVKKFLEELSLDDLLA